MRARIWYAITTLEKGLAVMIGRHPSMMSETDCTAPMPKDDKTVTLEETLLEPGLHFKETTTSTYSQGLHCNFSSSVSGGASIHTSTTSPPIFNYFSEHASITNITVEALDSLYCPETMKLSWFEVQQKIADLGKSLANWREGLPTTLDFGQCRNGQNMTRQVIFSSYLCSTYIEPYINPLCQKIALAFQYYHTRIIMYRPCLCRLSRQPNTESAQSKLFDHSAALACIESARETIRLLPYIPNPTWLRISPWWCLFHYLISAGYVLIVEIALRAEHDSSQGGALYEEANKLVYWLWEMGKDNSSAHRAWFVLSRLLATAAPQLLLQDQCPDDGFATDSLEVSGIASPMVGIESLTLDGFTMPNLTDAGDISQGEL